MLPIITCISIQTSGKADGFSTVYLGVCLCKKAEQPVIKN